MADSLRYLDRHLDSQGRASGGYNALFDGDERGECGD
jgi:hypothetical protein